MSQTGWSRRFHEPIKAGKRELVTSATRVSSGAG
jgi:hypothetical protein